MLNALLLAVLAAMGVADLATLTSRPIGAFGIVVWAIGWLALAAWAGAGLVRTVRDVVVRRTSYLTLAAAALVVVTVFAHVGDPCSLHHESTQELAQALSQWRDTPDRGFLGTALFGYPSRQFIVPALPSLLLGRSLFSLHLGFAACLLITLTIFARGLLDRFGGERDGDLLAATVLTLIPHLYFFNHFMSFFEQSILPFLFGLAVVGIALSIGDRSTRGLPWLLGIASLMLVHCYTPALALFGLVEAALVLLALSRPPAGWGGRATPLLIAAFGALSFAASLRYRGDLILFGDKSVGELWADLELAIRHVLVVPLGADNLVSNFLLFAVVLTVAAGLAFAAGWRGFAVAAWVCGVFVASIVSQGFCFYAIPMRVHRTLVAFPVLFALMATLWRTRVSSWSESRKVLALTAALGLGIGLAYQSIYLAQRDSPRNAVFLEWLQPGLAEAAPAGAVALFMELPRGDGRFENLADFTQYLLPSIRQTVPIRESAGCAAVLQSLADQPDLVPVVARTSLPPWEPCLTAWPAHPLGTFSFAGDAETTLYRLDRPTPEPAPVLHSP